MQDKPRLEAQLKELLRERVNIRLEQLTQDREWLAGRLQRIEAAIENISGDPEAAALKDLKRIKRTFRKTTSRTKQKNKKSPASTAKPVVAPTPKQRPAANRTKTNKRR
jgi:hypothetical protein